MIFLIISWWSEWRLYKLGEIVCYDHKAITLGYAQKVCASYKNNIKVTGKWVEDYGIKGDVHQWNEIHPVIKLTIP